MEGEGEALVKEKLVKTKTVYHEGTAPDLALSVLVCLSRSFGQLSWAWWELCPFEAP